jgi:hypothetical protein
MRDTARDTRCSDSERPELALEQEGSGLAIHTGGSGYDDLGDALCADALDQALHWKIIRPNAFKGGEELAEDEVASTHRACSLDRHEIVNASYDAQDPAVALGIGANLAHRRTTSFGDVSAPVAWPQLVAQPYELGPKVARSRFVCGEQPQHVALRRFFTDAGEARQKSH